MYVRKAGEKELHFQVSGMLWQRSLVMRDVETETLWAHLPGRAMEGELKGTELERIPSVITTWEDWKKHHPDSTVLAMSRTVGGYDQAQWEKPRRFVFGTPGTKPGDSPAVALRKLQRDGVVSVSTDERELVFVHRSAGGSVHAYLAGLENQALTFDPENGGMMTDRETGSRWSRDSGTALSGPLKGKKLTPVAGTLSFVQAWEAFFPKSEILR